MTNQQDDVDRPKRRAGIGTWLLRIATPIVAVAYVTSLIALESNFDSNDNNGAMSGLAVGLGVLGMFSALCAFVLAFTAAALRESES